MINHICPILGYQETYLAKEHSCVAKTLVITSNRYATLVYESNKKLLKSRRLCSGLFIEEGIKLLRLPVKFEIEPLDLLWIENLKDEIERFHPDIIIAHGIVNISSIRTVSYTHLTLPTNREV